MKDAPILLLDEPTSSVDAENEELIQGAPAAGAGARRLWWRTACPVADADRIVVLEDGRVVESGRHACSRLVDHMRDLSPRSRLRTLRNRSSQEVTHERA